MTIIIAEFCQNHNGDFNVLEQMIIAAAKAGATHAKIQSITADKLTYRPQFEEGIFVGEVRRSIKRPYAEEYNRLKGLELSEREIKGFISLCHEHNLIPMTTCFSRYDVLSIKKQGFVTVKVASYDCASYQLLRDLAESFEELIISTGAMYDEEIEYASNVLSKTNFSFLHCITIYPTPLEVLNLSRINWLRKFSKRVGFSDHTLVSRDGIIASKAALALGADIIERHFSIMPADQTRDGPVSINGEQLRELVTFSNLSTKDKLKELNSLSINMSELTGKPTRDLTNQELLNRDYYRGRFASPRKNNKNSQNMIFNWEETPI